MLCTAMDQIASGNIMQVMSLGDGWKVQSCLKLLYPERFSNILPWAEDVQSKAYLSH